MAKQLARPFSLSDAMALVAATGAGLAAVRAFSPEHYTYPYSPITPTSWLNRSAVVCSNWAYYLSPLVAAWTLTVLILRLSKPRPPRRRLFRQPGVTAGCAAGVGLMIGCIHFGLDSSVMRPGRYYNSVEFAGYLTNSFELTGYLTGIAVAAAWLNLALSGRWSSEKDWIDRLGRLLGILWITVVPLTLLRWFS